MKAAILKLLVKFSLLQSVPIPSYACSGTGYEEGSTLLFSTTTLFCDIKSDCYNKLNDRIVGESVFVMRFIVGIKSYMAKLPIKLAIFAAMMTSTGCAVNLVEPINNLKYISEY